MRQIAIAAVAMLVTGGAPCMAGGIRIGDTPAARIAKDSSIPGKGKEGQCLPFATALQKKLEAAGIAARVVVYGYEAGGVPATDAAGDVAAQPAFGTAAGRGSHAVVMYDDGGRIYAMDNQSWTPQWVHNAAPVQMAQQFSGINCSVKMARVLPMERATRETAVAVVVTHSTKRLAAN